MWSSCQSTGTDPRPKLRKKRPFKYFLNLGNEFSTSFKKISFSNLKQFYKRHFDKENEIRNKTVRYCHRKTIDVIIYNFPKVILLFFQNSTEKLGESVVVSGVHSFWLVVGLVWMPSINYPLINQRN